MALFTDIEPDLPPSRRRGWLGWSVLGFALIGVTVVAIIPAPYVIEQPGPVYDTLGEVQIDGESTPMIQIPGEDTYPTEGTLDMLTVSVVGNRENLPSWLEIAVAYFDPSKAVVPVDAVYPAGTSLDESNEQGRVDMANSQKEAVAAALTHLGYEFSSTLTVAAVEPDMPADGALQEGDIILSVNGTTFPDVTGLQDAIADNGADSPAEFEITRDGEPLTVEITPQLSDAPTPRPVVGILVGSEYDFPFDVQIQLENVGGPSAGMMFALGIIDKLTPGDLGGGETVAGTGTISADGEVGQIGGIRQKLYGARNAGADWFLAPAADCDEVTGHVPDGLTVFAVETLDEALAALEVVASGGEVSGVPTCPID